LTDGLIKGWLHLINMPEKGWMSLTVREDTGIRVKKLARVRELTVDEFVKSLLDLCKRDIEIDEGSRGGAVSTGLWSTCPRCRKRVKTENLDAHMRRVHGLR